MKKHLITEWVVVLAASAAIIAATFVHHAQGQDEGDDRDSRVELGFQIAPVPLNLEGRNRELVGLGSYWVNAVASCDDCHSAGPEDGRGLGSSASYLLARANDELFTAAI